MHFYENQDYLEIIYVSLSEKRNWHAKSHVDENREFKLDRVYFDLSPTVITALDLNQNAKNLIGVFFRGFKFYMNLIEVRHLILFNALRRNLEVSGNLWLRFFGFSGFRSRDLGFSYIGSFLTMGN